MFQINPNISLQALANPVNFADSLTKAQNYETNVLKLQALRDEYNAAKDERDRQKAIRQGMASVLQKIQQGTPAQYRTTFPQTMPTGQMPRQTIPPGRMPSGMGGQYGQNVGGTLGSLSTQLQNNIGQLGNARASGYIGQANAITGGLQGITDNLFRAASLFGGGL